MLLKFKVSTSFIWTICMQRVWNNTHDIPPPLQHHENSFWQFPRQGVCRWAPEGSLPSGPIRKQGKGYPRPGCRELRPISPRLGDPISSTTRSPCTLWPKGWPHPFSPVPSYRIFPPSSSVSSCSESSSRIESRPLRCKLVLQSRKSPIKRENDKNLSCLLE